MADNRYCRIRDRIGVDPLSEWGCRSGRNAKAPERAARTFRGLHRRSGSLFRAVEEAGQDAVVFFGFFGNLPIRGDIDMDEILFFQHFVIFVVGVRPLSFGCGGRTVTHQQPLHVPAVVFHTGRRLHLLPVQRMRTAGIDTQRAEFGGDGVGGVDVRPLERQRLIVPVLVDLIVWPIGNFESGCESFEVELFIEFVRCFFRSFFCIGEMVVDVVDAFGLADALFECVKAINRDPEIDVVYTDEDKLDIHYGEEDIVDVYAKFSKSIMESIIDGHMTFQRAFMTGEMTAKGNFKTLRMLDQIFPF